jgi:hypothetical protein
MFAGCQYDSRFGLLCADASDVSARYQISQPQLSLDILTCSKRSSSHRDRIFILPINDLYRHAVSWGPLTFVEYL